MDECLCPGKWMDLSECANELIDGWMSSQMDKLI